MARAVAPQLYMYMRDLDSDFFSAKAERELNRIRDVSLVYRQPGERDATVNSDGKSAEGAKRSPKS